MNKIIYGTSCLGKVNFYFWAWVVLAALLQVAVELDSKERYKNELVW